MNARRTFAHRISHLVLAALGCWLACAGSPSADAEEKVDYSTQVRPILARYCWKCHGADDANRQAGLRLDGVETATHELDSGHRAIVPGKPEESELVRRINAADEDEVMPPPATMNRLSGAQREVLVHWISEGAVYRPHWAFVPPQPAALPPVRQAHWPQNAIDHFVLARLEREGLVPSPEADRWSLARRVYLDLIGLPPLPEESEAFVNDTSSDAYEQLVDRLLASPHYGERWARRWLDLARYADTNGYEKDRPRSIWPYRDWVIRALNADLPFDQFTIQQLAGDMLPDATLDQRVATGFHRNTMLNEEGGIDPLEFRHHAVVDRANTTATVWLGLTAGCAQCHTHKYDPIPHAEYYQFLALLNNADEPELEVPQPEIAARRAELQAQIDALEADLPSRFPPEADYRWHVPEAATLVSQAGASVQRLDDGSLLLSGTNPETDVYTVELDSDLTDVAAARLETLTDPSLGKNGPGRTPHGNFVLSELTVSAAPRGAGDPQPVKLAAVEADVAQQGFPAAGAIDGDPKTGWAVHVEGKLNLDHAATFFLEQPVGFPEGTRWTIRLDQTYGGQHTIGRLRISLGQRNQDDRPLEVRTRAHLEQRFQEWLVHETARAVRWTVLHPAKATSNSPRLTVLDDHSVLSSGDQTKRDTYELELLGNIQGITALRLETLPDENLPGGGPGRVFYEGQPGDFFLSQVTLEAQSNADAAAPQPVALAGATQDFAAANSSATGALDEDDRTGWSIAGGQGQPHVAVFRLAAPLADAGTLRLRLICARYYSSDLGRFRISVTTDPVVLEAAPHPAAIDELLLVPADERTADQIDRLLRHFLSLAPELAPARAEIDALRAQLPKQPTTLAMKERPADNPRPTHRHHRGEFLQPREEVQPAVFSFLPQLPGDAPADRLALARWLVDPANPLTARVTVNRQWTALFGRGLVSTSEDFGFQGTPPTHPELLDWLALEFIRQGWSVKQLHRLIVTSATYRQASRVTPELLVRDPANELLARGPRFRLEGELVRDAALRVSGLLSEKSGGSSVFPPQPASVTTEGAYGQLAWNVSQGEDRYRRGLYTFSKRTAPFAMFAIFDAPSGEACVARREVSNTPLQALTLLNDTVFQEAAQALGRIIVEQESAVATWSAQYLPQSPPDEAGAAWLFLRCLGRPADEEERTLLVQFQRDQLRRFQAGELDAATLAGAGEGDPCQRAAWTAVARVLLNVDEFVGRR